MRIRKREVITPDSFRKLTLAGILEDWGEEGAKWYKFSIL